MLLLGFVLLCSHRPQQEAAAAPSARHPFKWHRKVTPKQYRVLSICLIILAHQQEEELLLLYSLLLLSLHQSQQQQDA